LQIRDNIALGNPCRAHDDAAIEEAARLGGASELIAELQDGFDTYLERPVHDHYSNLPEGVKTMFGRKVAGDDDFRYMDSTIELSGGQMQRLAVARTFMRSSTMEQDVGLLLFDEPSASLDPTAEHGTADTSIASLFFSPESSFFQISSRGFESCEGTKR